MRLGWVEVLTLWPCEASGAAMLGELASEKTAEAKGAQPSMTQPSNSSQASCSDKTLPFLDMASAGQAELGAPVKLTAAPGSGPHTFALSWEKPGNSDAISYYFRV